MVVRLGLPFKPLWFCLIRIPPIPTVPYLQITNPSLSFDRNGNFYVMLDEHNGGGTSGAIVLEKFAFTGDAPVASTVISNPVVDRLPYNIIYQWLPPGDQALPAHDGGGRQHPSFTDPTTGDVQTDHSSGNVYVAWATGTVAPATQSLWHSPSSTRMSIVMVDFDRWWARIQRSGGVQHQRRMGRPPSAMPSPQSRSVKDDCPMKVVSRGMRGSGRPGDCWVDRHGRQ